MIKRTSILVMALIVVVGCHQQPPPPPAAQQQPPAENSKAKAPGKEPAEKNGTFTLKAPTSVVTLERGKKEELHIALDPKGGFDQSVKLAVKPPRGVVASPADTTIKPGEEARVVVEAKPEAILGEASILVTGVSAQGETESIRVPIKVANADKGSE